VPTIGSTRLWSLFLTLPTHGLKGQVTISADGYDARRALSCGAPAGSSPSQAGHICGEDRGETTDRRHGSPGVRCLNEVYRETRGGPSVQWIGLV
jgi:hypothetical protein